MIQIIPFSIWHGLHLCVILLMSKQKKGSLLIRMTFWTFLCLGKHTILEVFTLTNTLFIDGSLILNVGRTSLEVIKLEHLKRAHQIISSLKKGNF